MLLLLIIGTPIPTIEAKPGSTGTIDTGIIDGEEVEFHVSLTASISENLAFKWKRNENFICISDTSYRGAQSDKLTIVSFTSSAHKGEYQCEVITGQGNVLSNKLTIKGKNDDS